MPKKKPNGGDSVSKAAWLIQQAVEAGLIAGEQKAGRSAKAPYKATERRLYHDPILIEKIEADRERLERMRTEGTPERSKGIARLSRPGYRVSPEEMLEALIADHEAAIAVDEYEVEIIAAALGPMEDDPYYPVIEYKYLQGFADEDIAEMIHCDKSTVYRQRKRLVTRVAVRLYGRSTPIIPKLCILPLYVECPALISGTEGTVCTKQQAAPYGVACCILFGKYFPQVHGAALQHFHRRGRFGVRIHTGEIQSIPQDADLDGFGVRVYNPILPDPGLLVLLKLHHTVMAGGGGGKNFDDQIGRALAAFPVQLCTVTHHQ